jgi:hypothetical protein
MREPQQRFHPRSPENLATAEQIRAAWRRWAEEAIDSVAAARKY